MNRLLVLFGLLMLAACGGDAQRSAPVPVAGGTVRVQAQQAPAPADYDYLVQQVYVGYFGRPADTGGLAYFRAAFKQAGGPTTIAALGRAYGANATLKSLVDIFSNSAESAALYPGDNQVFIDAVYTNLFNRKAEAAGKAYWADLLNRGLITRGNAAVSIMAAAQSSDAQSVANKSRVASDFTVALDTPAKQKAYSGMAVNEAVRGVLAKVSNTTDPATIKATVDDTVTHLMSFSDCEFTNMDHQCLWDFPIGYMGVPGRPPKSGAKDSCMTWQVLSAPVQLSTCSYENGGSGYTIIQNNGAKADLCWTVFFNNGSTSKGCHSDMDNGLVSVSSCFYCGAKNGGAYQIHLTRLRIK